MAIDNLRRVSLSNPREAIQMIERDGGVILTDFTTPDLVKQVNETASSYYTHNKDNINKYAPSETKRCSRLFGRSEVVREQWCQQPALLEILNYFIQTRISKSHGLQGELVTDPIISYSGTFNIGPGAPAQVLHRDDIIWQKQNRDQETTGYQVGSDIGMSLTVPGTKTTVQNGATVFYPGSHLWENSREPGDNLPIYAEMEVGEALLFLSSCLHGGGANKTENPRPNHGIFFCRSYIRPEENLHVWFTEEEVRSWSLKAQKQAGYVLDGPFLGYVDHHNAIDMFRANKNQASIPDMV